MTPEETARQAADILDELEKAVVGRRRTLSDAFFPCSWFGRILQGPAAADHGLLELVEDVRRLPRGLFRCHSCSNRLTSRASVRREMSAAACRAPPGQQGLLRVDQAPQGFVTASAAEGTARGGRLGVQVDAVVLGEPGGEQMLEHRPQVGLVGARGRQARGDDELRCA